MKTAPVKGYFSALGLMSSSEFADENRKADSVDHEELSSTADSGLDQYMKEVNTIPVLSHEKTVGLFHTLRDRQELLDSLDQCQTPTPQEEERRRLLGREISRIKEQLVTSNLRLVAYVANRYRELGVSLQDLIQEGNIGLIRAIDKFDHRLGYRFSTYAVWWIRQAMLKAIHQQGRTVRIPTHMWERYKRHVREQPSNRNEKGSIEDTRENDSKEMIQVFELMRSPLSLDTPMTEDGLELQELTGNENELAPDAQVIDQDLRQKLRMALRTLPIREEIILRLRYGIDLPAAHTLEEVGQLFHLTKERIRQIESRAVRRLDLT